MFQYMRVREGDGVPVTYTHETTLNQVLTRVAPDARRDLAFQMLVVLMRERDADRAEWSDGNMRITIEREGVRHAYNSEPTVVDQVRTLLGEVLKSDTLTPYVESRVRSAFDIVNPEAH